MKNIINRLSDQIEKDVISIYRHLHQYPELSFQEKETSFFIEEILKKEGIPHSSRIGGYGILARIEGKKKVHILSDSVQIWTLCR